MRHTICALLLVTLIIPASAAELSTLATAAAQGPIQALEKAYQQPGHAVKVQFDTSPNITKRLASGETPDVLIAQASTIEQLIKEGRAIADTRASLGRIGVGVAMGRGSQRPDVSSVDALKASLLRADTVVYSRGASGLLVEQMLRKIGVADQIKAKVVQLPTGADVMQRLGSSSGNQIGFTMVSAGRAVAGRRSNLYGVRRRRSVENERAGCGTCVRSCSDNPRGTPGVRRGGLGVLTQMNAG